MARRKRPFRPEDALRLKAARDPELSPDGRRVAFVVVDTDEEKDRLRSSIWVASVDGGSAPPGERDHAGVGAPLRGRPRVPVGQADELYAALKLLDKEVEFVRYPGGFHVFSTPS